MGRQETVLFQNPRYALTPFSGIRRCIPSTGAGPRCRSNPPDREGKSPFVRPVSQGHFTIEHSHLPMGTEGGAGTGDVRALPAKPGVRPGGGKAKRLARWWQGSIHLPPPSLGRVWFPSTHLAPPFPLPNTEDRAPKPAPLSPRAKEQSGLFRKLSLPNTQYGKSVIPAMSRG